MISVAMAPLAGTGASSMEQLHSRNGYRLAIHSSGARGSGARACCSKMIFPKAGLCYTSSWSSWMHQNQLDCSLLLSRARYRSSRPYRGVVSSSLFGVGAPEVLVIAVVALLVFGPKGLAEVARSLGQSLRAFQPTIRELQEVSKEFKQTLEKEIGLDELKTTTTNQKPAQPPQPAPPPDNENFVMEEITAGFKRMQQEKEEAAAQETIKQQEESPSTVVVASSPQADSTPAPVPSDVETTPVKEKEAAVNNVAKD